MTSFKIILCSRPFRRERTETDFCLQEPWNHLCWHFSDLQSPGRKETSALAGRWPGSSVPHWGNISVCTAGLRSSDVGVPVSPGFFQFVLQIPPRARHAGMDGPPPSYRIRSLPRVRSPVPAPACCAAGTLLATSDFPLVSSSAWWGIASISAHP